MLSLRSSVCPPPHSSLRFSLPPGGRWQSKTDGRSLRQYFLPPVNGYEAQATRALLHRKVRSITQSSLLGKVDCEARRMRLRCANNPSASLCSAPPFAQGRQKPHPPLRGPPCLACGLGHLGVYPLTASRSSPEVGALMVQERAANKPRPTGEVAPKVTERASVSLRFAQHLPLHKGRSSSVSLRYSEGALFFIPHFLSLHYSQE